MNCQLCSMRTVYYGKNSPCPDCKPKYKSASIETRETNGVQYYALKQTKSAAKQEVPYWIRLMESY